MAVRGAGDCDDLPLCLIASCSYGNPVEILQGITKTESLPEFETVIEDIVGFEWGFETKYYTCTVRLCKTDRPTLGNQQFANQLEAALLLFNPEQIESWTSVNSWLSYLEHLDPSVKLLVCDSCTDKSKISRVKVQEWCIDNEFELIELIEPPVPEDEDGGDTEYDDGIKRITQVLHAHTWPNLVMKANPNTISPYMKQLMDETKQEQQKAESGGGTKLDLYSELGMDAEELSDAINQDGGDGIESFEKLFSKLQLMKEKAESLPVEERKSYAEKVAMSFWTAIGGSDEEIDLSGESD